MADQTDQAPVRRRTATEMLASRLDTTFDAMGEALKIAAEKGAAAAVVHIFEYLDAVDADQPEDRLHFNRWVEAGRT